MPSKIRIVSSGPRKRRAAGGGIPAGCTGDLIRASFWTQWPGRQKPRIIVAVDPGANGSVVVMGIDGEVWGVCRVRPDSETDRDEQARRVAGVFRAVAKSGEPVVPVIETTFAPKNCRGYAAMRLGESRGMLIGLGIGAGLPAFGEVSASVWQRHLGVLTGGKKRVTRDRAQELFPELPHITNAEADGLLIAEWTRQQFAEIASWRR